MACTEKCLQSAAKVNVERAAWQTAWPSHCRKCEGAGAVHHSGYFDHKAGVGEPPSSEPCEGCTSEGKCARCGQTGLDQDSSEGPCSVCGWNYDDAMPTPYECDCWYGEEPDWDPA